jgi:hypothetical protein
LLSALAFVTAWSHDDGVDEWMRVASGTQTAAEWEHVATQLAELAYLLAGRVGLNERKTAARVLDELARQLADGEADGAAS